MALTSFKSLLQREFGKRQETDPNFSLRDFADFLKTDASQLSKIMTGKRNLSSEKIEKLGVALGISLPEIKEYQSELYEKMLKIRFQSLRNFSSSRRDHSIITMQTNASRIEEAKKLVAQFRRDLRIFLEKGEEKNCVYNLLVSLFPDNE